MDTAFEHEEPLTHEEVLARFKKPPQSDADFLRYEAQVRVFEAATSFTGSTIGPVAPPANFEAQRFIKRIQAYKCTAGGLGWIQGGELSEEIESRLSAAEVAIGQGDFASGRRQLQSLLLDLDSAMENSLAYEADVLLRMNVQFLLSRLI